MCTENLNSDVVMMKSAEDGERSDASGPLNRARDLVQCPMRSDGVDDVRSHASLPLMACKPPKRRTLASCNGSIVLETG